MDEPTKNKRRIDQVPMPKQDPLERRSNFGEVAEGYSADHASEEADRCLQCKKPFCKDGCPVNVDIPEFILALREKDMPKAAEILKGKNSLPGICGRVCPQETQCEEVCVLAKKQTSVAIGRLERYVADWERTNLDAASQESAHAGGKKIAVVGSGPAGLTCAGELAKLGYKVDILEALHVAGGVLMYGIPEFRLPKSIVQFEVDYIKSLGVDIKLNHIVGKTSTVDDLLQSGYDAVFLSPGAGAPMFLGIPGENLSNIYSANEFLTRTNLMKAYRYPEYDTPIQVGKRVAVFGAGNVAMDACRCALRLGAEEVYVIYRRSEAEMPARAEERENAKEEGVIFTLLTNPTRFIGDDEGKVESVELYEMELGEPDESGRRRPIKKPDTEYIMKIDTAIIALGTRPNPIIPSTTEGLELTKWGTVKTDETTGRTSKEGVWCGGDMATGAATVISAMGAGKRAAADIDAYFRGESSQKSE
ncbi:NADPH-dependent glutamate synthase [Chloroflexota bacterium]